MAQALNCYQTWSKHLQQPTGIFALLTILPWPFNLESSKPIESSLKSSWNINHYKLPYHCNFLLHLFLMWNLGYLFTECLQHPCINWHSWQPETWRFHGFYTSCWISMQNLLFVVVVVLVVVCLVVPACGRCCIGQGVGVGVEGITNGLHSDVSALPP